jgi:hypothetical protein
VGAVVHWCPSRGNDETPAALAALKKEEAMKRILAAGLALGMITGPVLANECPGLIQKAEEALKAAKLDDAKSKKIMDHIVQAKAEHDYGKHAEAVVTAKDALQLLGM